MKWKRTCKKAVGRLLKAISWYFLGERSEDFGEIFR
jgi:hypothetical protein